MDKATHQYRILAIDDEESVLSLIADTLSLAEDTPAILEAAIAGNEPALHSHDTFQVETCTSGEKGVEMVRKALEQDDPFSVALVDVHLGPGPNGVDIAERIRKLDPNVEIVIITGHREVTLAELNQRIPPPGRLLYLEKPFRPRELRQLAISLCSKWSSEGLLQDLTQSLTQTVDKRISQTRKLEQQLRQSQKMEALGTLAGGIAHDFNNILGVILGYAEIIRDSSGPDENLKRRVDEIIVAGSRARDLVNQVLNFSRQGPQKMQPLHLAPLVEESLTLLRPSLPEKIRITIMVQADNDQIAADPTQMHQVLLNLCTNAIQAMTGLGGELTISLDDVSEHETLPSGLNGQDWYVRLSVSDTGPGIKKDVMERIFDPFFTTKQPDEGTGLGLSVVHGILKAHGGAIEVKSELGKGTTFYVYLPRADAATMLESEAEATSMLLPEQSRVLFVDDELPLAEIGRELLEDFGFEVVVRTSSIEALEAFRFRPDAFDLVITDNFMPNMTGVDMAKEMLNIRPGLPIILCTGFSDSVSEKRVRTLGIGAMIKKPILKSKLVAAVARLLKPNQASGST